MTTYAVFPAGVAECERCGCDVTAENVGALKRVGDLASNAQVCIAFCSACAEAIDEERAAEAQPAATSMTLRRRPLGSHMRRHPGHGKTLAEDPPPLDQALTVAIGWPAAKTLPPPLVVIQPEDNPARLRFDVAAGRRVRVAHAAATDPDFLLKLAQALIDYGALCVDLIVWPQRRESVSRERLRVLPEARA